MRVVEPIYFIKVPSGKMQGRGTEREGLILKE